MSIMARLVLKNLNKLYDRNVVAVRDVNLVIEDKEFVVLVGPSGCGKTTILRMIAGLEEITAGDIFIGETKVNDVQPKDRDIAMVFQNYALYPHMTVYDNMAFALKMRKMPKAEIKKRVMSSAKLLGIEALLTRKPRQLSGGQRQRVALGRAIVRKPQAFLMDEPLSNLDAKLRVQMRSELYRLYKRLNTTVIYVTHDHTEAMTMGTRIVVLKDGEIQQADTPAQIYQRPSNTFVAGFIGTPPMNFIKGKVVRQDDKALVRFNQGYIVLPQDKSAFLEAKGYIDQEITLGVRGEDIILADVDPDIQSIAGEVEVVENLGAELNVHFNTLIGELVAKVHAGTKVRAGERVKLFFNIDKIHLFDRETGIRIV